MRMKQLALPMLGALSLALGSCAPTYLGATVGNGYGAATVGWQSAWYDDDGFPIYGYEGGRPVYGYTAAGAAIFSLSLITADCYVPQWQPASWYRGSYRYPVTVKRMTAPPRHPSAHSPAYRPERPLSREANRQARSKPVAAPSNRPGVKPGAAPSNRPGAKPVAAPSNRPGVSRAPQPSAGKNAGRGTERPQSGRPQSGHGGRH